MSRAHAGVGHCASKRPANDEKLHIIVAINAGTAGSGAKRGKKITIVDLRLTGTSPIPASSLLLSRGTSAPGKVAQLGLQRQVSEPLTESAASSCAVYECLGAVTCSSCGSVVGAFQPYRASLSVENFFNDGESFAEVLGTAVLSGSIQTEHDAVDISLRLELGTAAGRIAFVVVPGAGKPLLLSYAALLVGLSTSAAGDDYLSGIPAAAWRHELLLSFLERATPADGRTRALARMLGEVAPKLPPLFVAAFAGQLCSREASIAFPHNLIPLLCEHVTPVKPQALEGAEGLRMLRKGLKCLYDSDRAAPVPVWTSLRLVHILHELGVDVKPELPPSYLYVGDFQGVPRFPACLLDGAASVPSAEFAAQIAKFTERVSALVQELVHDAELLEARTLDLAQHNQAPSDSAAVAAAGTMKLRILESAGAAAAAAEALDAAVRAKLDTEADKATRFALAAQVNAPSTFLRLIASPEWSCAGALKADERTYTAVVPQPPPSVGWQRGAVAELPNGDILLAERRLLSAQQVTQRVWRIGRHPTAHSDVIWEHTSRFAAHITCMCATPLGHVFAADAGAHCIRLLLPAGVVAGESQKLPVLGVEGVAGSSDGSAAESDPESGSVLLFSGPRSLAALSDGSLVVADTGNCCVRRVAADLSGVSTLVTKAQLGGGMPVAICSAENRIFVAMQGKGRSGTRLLSVDLNSLEEKAVVLTELSGQPTAICRAPDTGSAIYVADEQGHVVWRVERNDSGSEWVPRVCAGTGKVGTPLVGFRGGQSRLPRPTAMCASSNGMAGLLVVVRDGTHQIPVRVLTEECGTALYEEGEGSRAAAARTRTLVQDSACAAAAFLSDAVKDAEKLSAATAAYRIFLHAATYQSESKAAAVAASAALATPGKLNAWLTWACSLVSAAPTLEAAAAFLAAVELPNSQRLGDECAAALRGTFLTRVERYEWPPEARGAQPVRDVAALIQLAQRPGAIGGLARDPALAAAVFGNDRFPLEMENLSLGLLAEALSPLSFTVRRDRVGDLRRAVVRWANRSGCCAVTTADEQPLPWPLKAQDVANWWSSRLVALEPSNGGGNTNEGPARKALVWAAVIYFEASQAVIPVQAALAAITHVAALEGVHAQVLGAYARALRPILANVSPGEALSSLLAFWPSPHVSQSSAALLALSDMVLEAASKRSGMKEIEAREVFQRVGKDLGKVLESEARLWATTAFALCALLCSASLECRLDAATASEVAPNEVVGRARLRRPAFCNSASMAAYSLAVQSVVEWLVAERLADLEQLWLRRVNAAAADAAPQRGALPPVPLEMVLRRETAALWPALAQWWLQLPPGIPVGSLSPLMGRLLESFSSAADLIVSEECTPDLVERVVETGNVDEGDYSAAAAVLSARDLVPEGVAGVWQLMGRTDALNALPIAQKRVREAFVALRQAADVCARLLPAEREEERKITLVLDEARFYTLLQLDGFLGAENDVKVAQNDNKSSEIRLRKALPQLLQVRSGALSWLHAVSGSSLFHRVCAAPMPGAAAARDQEGAGTLVSLQRSVTAWHKLGKRLSLGTVTGSEMESIGGAAALVKELRLVAASALRLNLVEGTWPPPIWPCVEAADGDEEWTMKVTAELERWQLAARFKATAASAMETIMALRPLLSPAGVEESEALNLLVRDLATVLDGMDLSALPVTATASLEPQLASLPTALLSLTPAFAAAVASSLDLMQWLRSNPDDRDFLSSLEMAMGKGEMEVPEELRVEGRVNEAILSQLRNVRTYLYPICYGVSVDLFYDDPRVLLDVMIDVSRGGGGRTTSDTSSSSAASFNTAVAMDQVIKEIQGIVAVRLPLQELLGTNSTGEDAAAARVLQLQQPKRGATWIAAVGADDDISLEYLQSAEGQGAGRYSLSDLLDFQASIVLGQTLQRGAETLAAIAKFSGQLSWMRELSRALHALHVSGHFSYGAGTVRRVSLLEDPAAIRDEARALAVELQQWEIAVKSARNAHYCLNYFTIGHLRWLRESVIAALDSSEMYGSSSLVDMCYGLLRCVQASAKAALGGQLSSQLLAGWRSDLAPFEELACLGAVISEFLSHNKVRPLHRPVIQPFPSSSDDSGAALAAFASAVTPGLHIVCCEADAHFLDVALSLYARAEIAPQRHELLVCGGESSALERCENAVRLWRRAHTEWPHSRLFCICGADSLPFADQQKLVAALREGAKVARHPLVLVIGSRGQDGRNEESAAQRHIASQFAHRRLPMPPLPAHALQAFLGSLTRGAVVTHVSALPGAGKSFQIRSLAGRSRRRYHYLPVHASLPPKAVLAALSEAAGRNSENGDGGTGKEGFNGDVYHFDVSDTVPTAFDALLFDLCIMGSVFDAETGEIWTLEENAEVAVEVPCGGAHVRTPSLLPQRVSAATPETFVSDAKGLGEGLGPHDFSAQLIDACNDGGGAKRPWNAYRRLQYVCWALSFLDERGTSFPHVFTGQPRANVTGEDVDLPAARCFELLVAAAKMRQAPSLWCIWSFVNCLFSQLLRLHHTESPVNCACMPDPAGKEHDKESKEKIKGEVIIFLIKTSREFATRQIRQPDPMQIVALDIANFSRTDFNGRWHRAAFDNDARPVFTRKPPAMLSSGGEFYLYFRQQLQNNYAASPASHSGSAGNSQGQWVIDDVIEPTGAVFSSSSGPDMASAWTSSPSWTVMNHVQVRLEAHPDSFGGLAVRVSGTAGRHHDGGSLSADDSGLYLRQPPFDDIAEQPHYIKGSGKGATCTRRHLFWSSRERRWQICPVCNGDEGAFALSATDALEGRWMGIPPDLTEKPINFELIYEEDPGSSGLHADTSSEEQNGAVDATWAASINFSSLLTAWNDSNHESLLFSNETHVVSFLSLDPARLKATMHPQLLRHLQQNGIVVGEDLNTAGPQRMRQLLSALTGARLDKKNLLDGGGYCVTGDALLKMLAIHMRAANGIPVCLLGECGCGKTALIKFLCRCLGANLETLDCHGGTSEDDIICAFSNAAAYSSGLSFVFLDEINACSHMGLLTEALCCRTLNGKPLPDNLRLLAALNPYRLRKGADSSCGMALLEGQRVNAHSDPMRNLVYRVHPVPRRLTDFIFDFGALTPGKELTYIESMVADSLCAAPAAGGDVGASVAPSVGNAISGLIHTAQRYVRNAEGDSSAVSLRDVRRCLDLLAFFRVKFRLKKKAQEKLGGASTLAAATVLAVAHVYYYRLPDAGSRHGLCLSLYHNSDFKSRDCRAAGLFPLSTTRTLFTTIIEAAMRHFCAQMRLEPGVAMNAALRENVFVLLVSILNKIPCFLVGRPGMSKTLAIQVIASNLQGPHSPQPFWKDYPAIYMVSYQCSPRSSANAIQRQFDVAVRYQERAGPSTVTVLLLDEVGLAEFSPETPLKVLHGILTDPPIAIIGISNWKLDPAKMNRAICLQRPTPSPEDIFVTGEAMSQGDLKHLLRPLAEAYHAVYTRQGGRDLVGMRDYYQLLRLLQARASTGAPANATELVYAVCRNFGLDTGILHEFVSRCFPSLQDDLKAKLDGWVPKSLKLIRDNLADGDARHLMVLTSNGAAMSLLFSSGLLEHGTVEVLAGSDFPDDRSELRHVQQINAVKGAMAAGRTLLLWNDDSIYEALFDVLNQRYLRRTDPRTGRQHRMLRLAIGSRSQLCTVTEGFRLIVVVEETHALHSLDGALLSRFEKQALRPRDVLTERQANLLAELEAFVAAVVHDSGAFSVRDAFCGMYDGTLASLLTSFSQPTTSGLEHDEQPGDGDELSRLKFLLMQIALPAALVASPEARRAVAGTTDQDGSLNPLDFEGALQRHTFKQRGKGGLLFLLTHSPASHLEAAIRCAAGYEVVGCLHLAQVASEQQFVTALRDFWRPVNGKSARHSADLQGRPRLLVIQSDPLLCSSRLVDHARYLCTAHRPKDEKGPLPPGGVVFVVHLPPGLQGRDRNFAFDFQWPWDHVFVDDLRPDKEAVADGSTFSLPLSAMLKFSAYELIAFKRIDLAAFALSRLPVALSSYSIVTPEVTGTGSTGSGHDEEYTYRHRLELLRGLFTEDRGFQAIICDFTLAVLRACSSRDSRGRHLHVAAAMGRGSSGSLRQKLEAALEQCCLSALTHTLAKLDCNCNLHLAGSSDPRVRALWQALARSETFMDSQALAATGAAAVLRALGPLAGSSQSTNGPQATSGGSGSDAVQALNTGRAWPLAARFPFSWRVAALVDAPGVKDMFGDHSSDADFAAKCMPLSALLRAAVGPETAVILEKLPENLSQAFLHDFTAMEAPALPSASPGVMASAMRSCLLAVEPSALLSPAAAYAVYWTAERCMFHVFCLLCVPSVANVVLDAAASAAALAAAPSSQPCTGVISGPWAAIDEAVIATLWSALDSSTSLEAWVALQAAVSIDIRALQLLTRKEAAGWKALQLTAAVASTSGSLVDATLVKQFAAVARRVGTPNCLADVKALFASAAALPVEAALSCLEDVLLAADATPIAGLVSVLVAVVDRSSAASGLPLLATGDGSVRKRVLRLLSCRSSASGTSLAAGLQSAEGVTMHAMLLETCGSPKDAPLLPTEADVDSLLDGAITAHALAAGKTALRDYVGQLLSAADLSEPDASSMAKESTASLSAPTRRLLERSKGAATFVLRVAYHRGGLRGLGAILSFRPSALPWLPQCVAGSTGKRLLFSGAASALDPFPLVFGAQYDELCAAVRSATCSKPNTRALDSLVASSRGEIGKGALLAALSTQIELESHADTTVLTHWLVSWLERIGASPAERGLYMWAVQGAPLHHQPSARLLAVHAAAVALERPESFPAAVLFKTASLGTSFVPGMPDDETSMVVAAMGGYVGWYTCPKGHPYTVGECTMPMELSRCLQCGAKIGGQNHDSVIGVKRVEANRFQQPSRRGYDAALMASTGSYSARQSLSSSAGTIAAVRAVLHAALAAALQSEHEPTCKAAKELVSSTKSFGNSSRVAPLVADMLTADLAFLRSTAGFQSANSVLLAMHMMLFECCKSENVTLLAWVGASANERAGFERTWAGRALAPALLPEARSEAEAKLRRDNDVAAVRAALGEQLWQGLHCDVWDPSDYWTPRELPSLKDLQNAIWLQKSELLEDGDDSVGERLRYSDGALQKRQSDFLTTFLRSEERLLSVKSLAGVLAWHSVLFATLAGDNQLRREEASVLTNAEVAKRCGTADASAVLEKFCEAFNDALPLVPLLYECQANPFLSADRSRVNLGGGATMGRDTPVVFALPAVAAQGETDAPGLCTVRILEVLAEANNALFRQLSADGAPPIAVAEEGDRPQQNEFLAPTTYLTPQPLVRQRALCYDRRTDLLPLLFEHHEQNGYDLSALSEALAARLLRGKKPLLLQIPHYRYRGQLCADGRLRRLTARVPQRRLEPALEESLRQITTSHGLSRLLAMVEDVVSWALVSPPQDGSALLEEFALGPPLVSKSVWEVNVPMQLRLQAKVGHLQALLLALDQMATGSGGLLDNVALCYRDALDASAEAELRAAVHRAEVGVLEAVIAALHDLLREQLVTEAWDGEASLAEYLGYAMEAEGNANEFLEKRFPTGLRLRHALASYRVLCEADSSSAA